MGEGSGPRRPVPAARRGIRGTGPVLGLLGLCLVPLLGACAGNPRASGSTDAAAPPPVVAQDAGAFSSIEVEASRARVEVAPGLRAQVAPLRTIQALGRQTDLAGFGLDRPQARLVYHGVDGRALAVWVGGLTADRLGIHVMRDGDDHVFLALAETLRPVLALAGVTVPPPPA